MRFYRSASALTKLAFSQSENRFLESGYPAWIRTKNNASKGRCVTVTPRGKSAGRFTIFDGTAEVATGAAKQLTRADEISSPLNTPKDAKIHRRKKLSGSAERHPTKRSS
jgi:hypothetical protein